MKRREKERRRAALEMDVLFALAREAFGHDTARAHRYMGMVYALSLRSKTPLTKEMRASSCKSCGHFLAVGVNCRVRTREGHTARTCLDCGMVRRFGYVREKKEQRAKRRKSGALPVRRARNV